VDVCVCTAETRTRVSTRFEIRIVECLDVRQRHAQLAAICSATRKLDARRGVERNLEANQIVQVLALLAIGMGAGALVYFG